MAVNKINFEDLKEFLDQKVLLYNCTDFIEKDPILIPHSFSKKEDVEIMGFFASIFAWGQRSTIINKCKELSARMENSPHEYIMNAKDQDIKSLIGFKHRTFNDTDLLYCIDFFKRHYTNNTSLESAFFPMGNMTVEDGLVNFHCYFFESPDAPIRTKKHVSTPLRKSACKRLNMFLRWMVRNDDCGVDFGLWNRIQPKDLICPLDLHVERTAKKLGLIKRNKADWQAALELTQNLKDFDPNDPVKYDFALFGVSIEERCMINEVY